MRALRLLRLRDGDGDALAALRRCRLLSAALAPAGSAPTRRRAVASSTPPCTAGEELVADAAFLVASDAGRPDLCACWRCLAPLSSSEATDNDAPVLASPCVECYVAVYCGDACTAADATDHSNECAALRRTGVALPPARTRLVRPSRRRTKRIGTGERRRASSHHRTSQAARLLMAARPAGSGKEDPRTFSAAWIAAIAAPAGVPLNLQAPSGLPPDVAAETAADAAAALAWLAAGGEDLGEAVAAAEAAVLLVRTHALTVGGERGRAGLAMFKLLPLLNHACDATCAPAFQLRAHGGVCRARLRATRALAAGTELTLCYTDAAAPGRERRAALQRHFLFECWCARCQGRTLAHRAAEALRSAAPAASSRRRAAAAEAMATDDWRTAATILEREARERAALRPSEGFGGGVAPLDDIALQLQLANAWLQAGETARARDAAAAARTMVAVSDPDGGCTTLARAAAAALDAELSQAA